VLSGKIQLLRAELLRDLQSFLLERHLSLESEKDVRVVCVLLENQLHHVRLAPSELQVLLKSLQT